MIKKERQNKEIPLEGLIPGGKLYDKFQPEKIKNILVLANIFCYTYQQKIHLLHPQSGEKKAIALKAIDPQIREDTLLNSAENHCIWYFTASTLKMADLDTKKTVCNLKIKKGWENFDYSTEAKMWAYTCGNGLYLLNREGKSLCVFKSKSKGITAGQRAARDEFGIEKGTFWSPDGQNLAFYLIDEREVTSYPLVDIKEPIAKVRTIKYPMAGQRSQHATVGIYHLESKQCLWIEKQGADKELFKHFPEFENGKIKDTTGVGTEDYVCCTTFSPDSHEIYVAELKRNQKHFDLNCFDVETGHYKRTLFSEEDPKYTEPQQELYFITDKEFIWQSRRDGWNHLYLYNFQGKLQKQLTRGKWEVTRLIGKTDKKELLIECTQSSPLNRDICLVNLQGNLEKVSEGEGIHQACLMQDYILEQASSTETPYEAQIGTLGEKKRGKVVLFSPNPLKGYEAPKCDIWKERIEGNDFYCRMVYPTSFDATRKYPLITYLYGGPHVQLIRNDWNYGTAGFEYMMAQKGYLVFSMDPRGSDNRGRDFEQACWRNIGHVQLEDHLTVLQKIISKSPYINPQRLGVYGWSFGGFMSTHLMLNSNGLFKVGVAGGPVINWRYYEVMYTERYMDTPQENPEGYEENDMRTQVSHLKGKLMLLHCNTDPVVLWQNSLMMLKAAVKAKVQIDYNVYVGYPHNVRGRDRVHLMEKIRDYFIQNL